MDEARCLDFPQVTVTTEGETENLDFWQEHEELLQIAWKEWSNIHLPTLDEVVLMNPTLYQHVHQLWQDPTLENEMQLQELWKEVIPGVWVCHNFFTLTGLRRIRYHYQAAAESGIPTRRPNGMNRLGLVWDDETPGGVSYPQILEFRKWLVDLYVRPLSRAFFPHYSGIKEMDDVEAYAFTIHYATRNKSNETNATTTMTMRDARLPEHSDASLFTININLNLPEEDYEGSVLEFGFEDENGKTTKSALRMESGMAVLHRGMQRHQALSIQSGERHQMVLWLFGRHGYVRVIPYERHEQRPVEERWSLPTTISSGDEGQSNCDPTFLSEL